MHSAMGHEFGPNLICECGATMNEHERRPRPCRRFKAQGHMRTISDDQLATLRVAMGIPLHRIATGLGISISSAKRAVNGEVGGKGRTSPEVRTRVMDFLGVESED